MVSGTASAVTSLAALAAEIAAARAVMAPALPDTVFQQVESVRSFEGRYALERIPMPAEGDPEVAARAFNEVARPRFARSMRPIFDERLALEVLKRQGIQFDALKIALQIPEAVALGLITLGIAEGFLAATEGELNAVVDRGLRILERAPAQEFWRDPALVLGLGGILVGIIGLALEPRVSSFAVIWILGTFSLAYGISRVNAASAAMRRTMGDLLEQLSGGFQAVGEAQRRLMELRPEILRAATGSGDQAVTRLRPPSLER